MASSPDRSAQGLTTGDLDPMRYDGAGYDPREVTGIFHAMMPDHARVLDVGCGTGAVTLIANRDRQNEVVAVEPDADRADLARSRGLIVHNAMLEPALQDELGLFDVVMTSDVLEHTPAPEAFLATLARSLKPGGTLLLSVPNVGHWSVRWMVLTGRFDYQPTGLMDATHLRWFTAASLRRLLDAAGFEVVEMRQTIGAWVPDNLRAPLNYLPDRLRRRLLVAGTKLRPTLFGIQHVVKARMR